MPLEPENLLKILINPDYRPSKTRDIFKMLGIPEEDYQGLRELLKKLEKEGRVVKLKGGKWSMPDESNLIYGRLEIKRKGFGFLIPDDPKQEDIYIPENELKDGFNGDKVVVKIKKGFSGRGHRKFGTVVRIIERTVKRMVCTVESYNGNFYCLAEGSNLPYEFEIIQDDKSPEYHENDKILLEIKEWPSQNNAGKGMVIERLGPAGEPDTETAAILANYEVETEFPDEVMSELKRITQTISEHEKSRRFDFTEDLCYTIDPDDAKDFDDAISIKRTKEGFEIGVHIADVSHFICEGSALFEKAKERSTSIYLPERVIPMIPHELSSDICSLRPDEERLAMSVFMSYDRNMELIGYKACRSVIRSKKRFTYRQVFEILSDDNAAAEIDEELLSSLRMLYSATMTLRKKRLKAGSIELNLPEHKVLIDEEGNAKGMIKVEHDFSHQMVEECMLAANVTMARYAVEYRLPVLYRVHEAPENESLTEMAEFLNSYGYNFRLPFNRKNLNKVLNEIHGKPEEHAINLAILLSMKQAVYSPQLLEHFALAFSKYTHFTSPIRRFPDLHLHTSLKKMIKDGGCWLEQESEAKGTSHGGQNLLDLGNHCSTMERRAMKVESEVKELRRLELLSKAEQKIHKAVVTGIRDFGVFVEIEEYFVEGLLRRDDLQKNGRAAIEIMPGKKDNKNKKHHSGKYRARGFHLGEEVLVSIASISMVDRKCNMEYVGEVEE